MIVFCDENGWIGVATQLPRYGIFLAQGPAKATRNVVAETAIREGGRFFVPGYRTAMTAAGEVQALAAYVDAIHAKSRPGVMIRTWAFTSKAEGANDGQK